MAFNITLKDYPQHKISVINIINNILLDEPDRFDDELIGFNLLAARLFASSSTDEFLNITDGKNDQGIDFYTEINDSFEIFQCKFAEFETIKENERPISFNQDGVRDILNAYRYLFSDTATSTANTKVKNLRTKIMLGDYTNISFNLCVFGELTEDAIQKYNLIKQEYEQENIAFNLFQWKDIITEILLLTCKPQNIKFKFRVNDNQILSKNDYCYFLAHAVDFANAFREFGWSIFDLNVRSELKNSPINKDIIESLKHHKTMRFFHHLNNGILIFCDSYKPLANGEIEIRNFQIINGCQTVRSIDRAFNTMNNSKMLVDEFINKCLVQVKIICKNTNTEKLMDQIIVSSNNQNPMSKRNLKSNTQEQLKIKSMLENLPYKWFYQRKDGELDSYKGAVKFNQFKFRISDFKDGNTIRFVDNNELAKSWICFIGLSNTAMMSSDFFKKEQVYDDIFNSYPSEKLWDDFINSKLELTRKEDYFIPGARPSAAEYLLSSLIWRFIKEYSLTPKENRRQALERGVINGELQKNSEEKIINSPEAQSNYLIKDNEYMVNNIINNSKEVLLEMFSFVLTLKYGHGQNVAENILNNTIILNLLRKPDFYDFIVNMPKNNSNLFYSIYEFLKFTLGQLYIELKGDYIAASRRKSYLSTPNYIRKFKSKIIELDKAIVAYVKPWKEIDNTMLESLPKIRD